MKRQINLLLTLFCFTLFSVTAMAQSFTIKGKVVDQKGEPIFYAVVVLKNTNIYTTTDNNGFFTIRVPKGNNSLVINSLGYVEKDQPINAIKNMEGLVIELIEASLQIDEVVVTARQTQSRQGTTTYKIGEDAIKQVQAMSLSDIMSLLPGNKVTPPKFNSPSQINLRNASSGAQSVNSFGTSIVIDGTPLSNDANMQAINPATGTSGGTNVANRGIDLREVQVSNIESVEVVAGVPSAKYGNLTSGTVLITRKAGQTPTYVNFNTTPTSYQFGASRGFRLPKEYGFLNTDVDYTYSNSRPTEKAHYFQRVNFGLRWSAPLKKDINWTNTTSFSFGYNKDGLKNEKDRVTPNYSETNGKNFSFAVNGRADVLGTLNYNFGISYSNQYSMFDREAEGPVPIIQPTESGTYFTTYSPLRFNQKTVIEGGPLSVFARVDASQMKKVGQFDLSFMTGMEYNYSKNLGKGRVTSGSAVMSSNMPGSRDAKFHEVPASTIFAVYHETDINHKRENSSYLLRLGGRYDNMNSNYNLFSPRLSFTARYYETFRVRAAWGLSYKAPSMLSLHPGPVYFDITNLSYYHNDPASRLAIVTTYVHQPTNDHLKPSKGDTKEIGFDFEKRNFSVRLTGFIKELSNGISTSDRLMVMQKQNYRVVSQPVGEKPVVEAIPGDIVYLPRVYSQFVNNEELKTHGLELTIEPPRIAATNTSFMLSGSLMKSSNYQNTPKLRSSQINTNAQGNRYGVYESTEFTRTVSTANLTVIQHLPQLRMLITFITELNIYENRDAKDPSNFAFAYYDRMGNYIEIPQSARESEEYKDLRVPVNTYTYIDPPFYPNFHLQIRKETKQGHSFSFYANNCLWYNPTYTNDVNNTKIRLNSKVSFGFGVSVKL